MKKYIATWDIGYGEQASVIQAKDDDDARAQTYELAREDFENNVSYKAHPWSQELAEQLSIEDE